MSRWAAVFFFFLFLTGPVNALGVGEGFGIQIKETIRLEDLGRIRAAGFGFVRLALYWDVVEREKGRYQWEEMDVLLRAIRQAGLGMMLTVTSGHAAYDGVVKAPRGNIDGAHYRTRAPARAESQEAFARFAAAAAVRYGGPDVTWEVWNEPDLRRFWSPRPDASAYTALALRSCMAIREVDPNAFVMGPALGRVPDVRDGTGPEFLDAVLRSRAAQCFDAISLHPYRYGGEEPENVADDYKSVTQLMAQARLYKPLVRSEWGYSIVQTGEAAQADYVLRGRLVDMLWGIQRSVWYEWQDSKPNPEDIEGGFGLVQGRGAAKESLKSGSSLLPALYHAQLDQRLFTGDNGQYILQLRDAGGQVVVLGWRTVQGGSVACLDVDGRAREELLEPRVKLLARGREIRICGASEWQPDARQLGRTSR